MLKMQDLTTILEDHNVQYESAKELIYRLHMAKQQIENIEFRLAHIKHKLNYDLALRVRRLQPGLNIAVDRKGCKIGYKTKTIILTPDLEYNIWHVESQNTRFLKEFYKAHRNSLVLNFDLEELSTAIVGYFASYYRTLSEEIVGTGKVLIENRVSTFANLAQELNKSFRGVTLS